ncbi:mitosis entry checkpoint [Yamadazyma tenuis]|uniref:Checkpoint protein n=1 Tax=Candida tenuis (strain ATCC 10573 / BCRC 21748 / CBS 615 / JCM 9827 / NBRC 10315 / NRRL Y-1498 / VKM Y-70) TaxID=590646 RepID=G3BEZ5_CANTC|nr:uncharacterized protein CANTEDRAFT_126682 [Yamadazyma tenuis ATCC 10573]EGV59972.1 hypothetical protein CANTEDRAFT_126682 [Yamadazyma tenuis ATCC 10573]WEJ94799.1 mitosis entry checkpoint [Yamadazyma tenuis]
MKLKLLSRDSSGLLNTLSLISSSRKFVVLRFTPTMLVVISVSDGSVSQEPQIWCKLKMQSLFEQVELVSINDNTISLELNCELLLQTLRHFERANSDGLNLRLQRKPDGGDDHGAKSRAASLALFYSHVNDNGNSINHTFKIPVKILKSNHESMVLKEPELPTVDLIMPLPKEFVSTYKRLDKFRRTSNNEIVTIKCTRRGGGFLGFLLVEEGKYKVTISLNEKLDIRKPPASESQEDSLVNTAMFDVRDPNDYVDEQDENEDKTIHVRLRDWKMASKIVASCKVVILLLVDREVCVLHCLLDDSESVEIIYYISGIRSRDD